jgi:hypothetical protein
MYFRRESSIASLRQELHLKALNEPPELSSVLVILRYHYDLTWKYVVSAAPYFTACRISRRNYLRMPYR